MKKYNTKPEIDRFMKFVVPEPNSGCWLWSGSYKGHMRYGRFRWSEGSSAHRFSYNFFCGAIPEKMSVLHKCDVTCCVNPDHLFIGTSKDNAIDMVKKGRVSKKFGETNGSSKLTKKDVLEIRAREDIGKKKLASLYGVSPSTILAIKRRNTWADVR